MNELISIVSFFLVGLTVKYIDASYDDNVFSRRSALILSPFVGALLGLIMAANHSLLVLSLSIIIGVFVTGKLDILPFRLLVSIALGICAVTFHGNLLATQSDWYVFVLFTVGAVSDELGNDLADAMVLKGVANFFFMNRGSLKFLALVLVAFKYLPMDAVLAFLAFDLGYLIISKLSLVRVHARLHSLEQPHRFNK
jgi:hypothetical protein